MSESPLNEFFLVCLPGFEDLAVHELKAWLGPEVQCEAGHGGVTVHTDLRTGLSLNLVLKIPTRILLRVDKFRCRDFPKLFKKVSEFPWEKVADINAKLEVEVSSSRSRLKMKKRIAETCLDGWRKRVKVKPNPDLGLTLFVRLADDECTLSLDTSGERLHKRGARTHIGEAPIRETIAAALLEMTAQSTEDKRAVEVVDPMMGSGTFLLEALTRDKPVHARGFGFEAFKIQGLVDAPALLAPRPQIAHAVGFEADAKTVSAAEKNLKKEPAEIIEQDFFKAEPLPQADGVQRWVLANPPYGERLKVKVPLKDFYQNLFRATETVAKPDRACFILPAKAVKGRFDLPPGWKVLEKRSFSNGGIPVIAFLFGR